MAIDQKTMDEMKARIQDFADNFPDVNAMVANGELVYKAGWYEATTKEAMEKVGRYVTAVRQRKNGNAQFKLMRLRWSGRLKRVASKL